MQNNNGLAGYQPVSVPPSSNSSNPSSLSSSTTLPPPSSSVVPTQQSPPAYAPPTPAPYHPPQPLYWNNGLKIPRHASISAASVFSLADIEDHLNRNNSNGYYSNPFGHLPHQQQSSQQPSFVDYGYGPDLPGTGHSNHYSPNSSAFYSNNPAIASARNKLRILAMLDDVRKKREQRDRRKSDLIAYFDDLILPDDPVATTGAAKLYRRRFKIYQFLNHPSTGTPWSITYHVLVFVLVFVCLILTICATIQHTPLQEKAIRSVAMLEKIVITWFNIEFGFGLWSCSCKKRYRGFMGKVRYVTIPSRLIDLVILSFTTIVLVFNPSKTGHEIFVVSTFRGFHRFFQVAQVLTLNRPLKPWKVLASVIYDQREQLFIIYYTEFIVLCVLAYIAFLVERDTNENFNSIADAMWWAIVTLSTVGYGDRVPVTWIGKIISTMFTILGVAIFALPAGIIGTGLALKIEEVERNQIRNRKKVAAAILIQRSWRSWKAHETYELVSKFFRERPMPIYKQHDYFSMAQKFIALVQFYIALNKFRELLRPLDLKTVMQSYSDGQTEVLLRTKLVQQSIEELTRRVELNENRVGNMSMRIETKQNTFERRVDHIRQLLESCHRQLLANHLLVELLRTNNSRHFLGQVARQTRAHPSSFLKSRPNRTTNHLNKNFKMTSNTIPEVAVVNKSNVITEMQQKNPSLFASTSMKMPENGIQSQSFRPDSPIPTIEVSDNDSSMSSKKSLHLSSEKSSSRPNNVSQSKQWHHSSMQAHQQAHHQHYSTTNQLSTRKTSDSINHNLEQFNNVTEVTIEDQGDENEYDIEENEENFNYSMFFDMPNTTNNSNGQSSKNSSKILAKKQLNKTRSYYSRRMSL